ncbi:MAG: substrate-binding domain-containing protein [Kiritimatiellae bacterium]|nr:substrate-binding domain-containing protein [Kiritimatiellia bacterium]
MVPNNPSQCLKLAGIRRYAGLSGMEVATVTRDELRQRDVRSFIADYRPGGVIVEGSGRTVDYMPDVLGAIPASYIEYPAEAIAGKAPDVVIDDAAVADAAFRELSQWKPAAFAAVGFIVPHPWSRMRVDAFMRCCRKEGAECEVFPTNWPESEESRFERLSDWVADLPGHTAIFTASDATAETVERAAIAAHRHIPKDISICSTDNISKICENAPIPLTSIQLDFERIGFVAARALVEITVTAGTTGTVGTTGTCFSSGLSHSSHLSHPSHPSQLILPIGPLLVTRRKSTSGRGRHEPWILRAVEIIRAEACNGITITGVIDRLEKDMGRTVPRRTFDLRFREAMGHTANEEILSVRLESACALLAQTDTPVTIVHDFCGFGCYSALDAVFRSRFGMSMGAWRGRNFR